MIPLLNPLLYCFFEFFLKKSHSNECFASDGWKHRFQQVEALLPMGGNKASNEWKERACQFVFPLMDTSQFSLLENSGVVPL